MAEGIMSSFGQVLLQSTDDIGEPVATEEDVHGRRASRLRQAIEFGGVVTEDSGLYILGEGFQVFP